MNGYDLTRAWFEFCFSNPRKVRPIHHAIIHWAFQKCNELGWPEEFQFPTDEACEVLGIQKPHTFRDALKELIEFGAIRMVQESTGRYVARWVSLIGCPIYIAEKGPGNRRGNGRGIRFNEAEKRPSNGPGNRLGMVPNIKHIETKQTLETIVDDKGAKEFSNTPLKGFEKKIPPVAPAPLFGRIASYEEAARIILANEDLQRITWKEIRNARLTGSCEMEVLVEEFILDKRMENGDDIPWKSEKDVKSHFRNWITIKLPLKAKQLNNGSDHYSAGKSAANPVSGRKYTPTYKSGSSRDLPVDDRNADSRIIRIDGD